MQGVTGFRDLRTVRSMEPFCNCYLDVVGLEFEPAAYSSSGTCCFKPCFSAFGDDIVFKLCQPRNELEKQYACRCACIHIFCERHQIDVPFFQFFQRFDELLQ